VKIPAADFASARRLLRGTGFDDGQIQKSGDSTVISFRLEPGTTARVDQRSNRLDVVFSTVGKGQKAAAASVSVTSALTSGHRDITGPFPPASQPRSPDSRNIVERPDSSSANPGSNVSGQNNLGSQVASKSGSSATPVASSSSAVPTSAT